MTANDFQWFQVVQDNGKVLIYELKDFLSHGLFIYNIEGRRETFELTLEKEVYQFKSSDLTLEQEVYQFKSSDLTLNVVKEWRNVVDSFESFWAWSQNVDKTDFIGSVQQLNVKLVENMERAVNTLQHTLQFRDYWDNLMWSECFEYDKIMKYLAKLKELSQRFNNDFLLADAASWEIKKHLTKRDIAEQIQELVKLKTPQGAIEQYESAVRVPNVPEDAVLSQRCFEPPALF